MKRFSVFILCMFIAVSTGLSISFAAQPTNERRIALVIGNSAYKSSPLRNPVNDAQDIAAALKKLGFDVMHSENADQITMKRAIRQFGRKLREGGIGLFYYAGHGVQVKGRNYLIPIGAQIETESEVEYEAVDAGRVLGQMEDAGNDLNIAILDACRDNPFTRSFRSREQGLAKMDAPKGSLIAYSTAPGSVAADGKGRNGIYTKYLLKHMRTPGLTIERVLKKVRIDVMGETVDKQVPWESSSLRGDFYFASSGTVMSRPSAEPAVSFLEISANITDTRVLVDGREIGSTPVTGITLSPGSHRIRVEKEGYEAYEKQVRAEAGRTFSMQVYLDKMKPRKGRLYVETDPRDAKVNIPGIGRFYQGMELGPGRYMVVVSSSGYEAKELSVTVDAGEDKSLDIRLEKLISSALSVGDVWKDPLTDMEFVWVPAGCFQMGSPNSESGVYSDEGPVHEVCVDGFWMSKYEVTNAHYRNYKSNHDSKSYEGKSLNGKSQPAVNVSWEEAKAYSKWMTRKHSSMYEFRLPTEAEWEYAGRAGTTTARYWGNNPDDACRYANVHDLTSKLVYNFKYQYHNCEDGYAVTSPVGSFTPNRFGLYDMLGNVWEWCEDIYSEDAYRKHKKNNPLYTKGGTYRVNRGGSWVYGWRFVRSTIRYRDMPGHGGPDLGFRLVRTPEVDSPKNASISSQISTPKVIARDGHYIAYANGVVRDTITGLEWFAGSNYIKYRHDARKWVRSLTIAGGGWRIPTKKELKTLYKGISGGYKLTTLLKPKDSWAWAIKTKDSSYFLLFSLADGGKSWYGNAYREIGVVIAVRSRR